MRLNYLRSLPKATDAVFVLAGEPRVLVPERTYTTAMARHEIQSQFGRRTLVTWFRVVALGTADAPYDRLHLPMYFPMTNGTFGPGSKFATLWARLAGCRPGKGERISTAIFRDRLFTIRTKTVKENHRQRPHGPLAEYSVVDDIVAIEAGGSAGRP